MFIVVFDLGLSQLFFSTFVHCCRAGIQTVVSASDHMRAVSRSVWCRITLIPECLKQIIMFVHFLFLQKMCVCIFACSFWDSIGWGGPEHLVLADEGTVELAVHWEHAEDHQTALWNSYQQVTCNIQQLQWTPLFIKTCPIMHPPKNLIWIENNLLLLWLLLGSGLLLWRPKELWSYL